MMSYINETDFVIDNKKLVYPEIVTDGLQLYYDAKGKRDTDYHRDTMLDMSGNKNHGKLYNFAYEKHSGYRDGLVFDYIDDKLVRPALNLKPNDFTFMLNGNIISFSPDGTVKRVQDGEVIESKGFNLVRNGDFVDGITGWSGAMTNYEFANGGLLATPLLSDRKRVLVGVLNILPSLSPENVIYVRVKVDSSSQVKFNTQLTESGIGSGVVHTLANNIGQGQSIISTIHTGKSSNSLGNNYKHLTFDISSGVGDDYSLLIKEVQLINLTETFGAGNEPTKEQMDEIINRFGFIPNAQDLIDRIEYKGNDLGDMENIIDGLYKTEVLSGTEIYTDKADEEAMVHVEVDGKSYQNAGSGKNLLIGLVSGYVNTNGIISRADAENMVSDFIEIDIEKEYVYSLWVTTKTAGNWTGIGLYDVNKNFITRLTFNANNNLYSYEYRTVHLKSHFTPDTKYIRISSRYLEEGKAQLEEGSTATAYEPPAPTPDYPIEIHSLNDFDVVSSVGGRNLFLNTAKISGLGTERVVDNRYFYDIPYGVWINDYYVDLIAGTTYTLRVPVYNNNDVSLTSRISVHGGNTYTHVVHSKRVSEHKVTFTPEQTTLNARFFILTESNTRKLSLSFGKAKFEVGSIATDWTPAPEDITEDSNHPLIDKINLLLDEPLRSVGDVKDRLFRDNDGLWKIERKIRESKMTSGFMKYGGSQYAEGNNHTTFVKTFSDKKVGHNTSIMSHLKNFGKAGYWDNPILTGYTDHSVAKNIYMYMPNNILGLGHNEQSILANQKMNEWATQNPITVQYVLETPTIETLPQPLQDKLNNITSYANSNYIYTVLPDKSNILHEKLKPTLHTKFLYSNWYKEDRVINNLMLYNRALTNEEMLQNYKTIKRRWGM